MAEKGNVDEHMMYNTFNMGLGMIVAVDPADVDKTMEAMRSAGDRPYVVGKRSLMVKKGVDHVKISSLCVRWRYQSSGDH